MSQGSTLESATSRRDLPGVRRRSSWSSLLNHAELTPTMPTRTSRAKRAGVGLDPTLLAGEVASCETFKPRGEKGAQCFPLASRIEVPALRVADLFAAECLISQAVHVVVAGHYEGASLDARPDDLLQREKEVVAELLILLR